jgi:hypothetical protein
MHHAAQCWMYPADIAHSQIPADWKTGGELFLVGRASAEIVGGKGFVTQPWPPVTYIV